MKNSTLKFDDIRNWNHKNILASHCDGDKRIHLIAVCSDSNDGSQYIVQHNDEKEDFGSNLKDAVEFFNDLVQE